MFCLVKHVLPTLKSNSETKAWNIHNSTPQYQMTPTRRTDQRFASFSQSLWVVSPNMIHGYESEPMVPDLRYFEAHRVTRVLIHSQIDPLVI